MAIGCVLFSAGAVAAVTHYALGLSWAVGFVLGAIVSPPDAVAAMALLKHVRLPRRTLMVLEGESLVNDATALVAFSLAVQAVQANAFSPTGALAQFLIIVSGEIAYGCAIAFATLRLRHIVDDPRAEILLALATPYLTFWPPHELGGSGVVACVAGGLYVSWNGRNYIRPATRLQGYFIWDLVTWCIEALTFLVCGLQTREIIGNLTNEGWPALVTAGFIVAVTVIVVRFVWVFPVTYLPRLLWPPLRKREPAPNWKPPFLVGFTGLRGAVSLAAALSIPLAARGSPFPHRDLILFSTICVIMATLVGQGAVLGSLVRWLDLGHVGRREAAANRRAENAARVEAIDAVLARLGQWEQKTDLPRSAIQALKRFHAERKSNFASGGNAVASGLPASDVAALSLELIGVERNAISAAYEENRIGDEARRRSEREFDLEEASIRHGASDNFD